MFSYRRVKNDERDAADLLVGDLTGPPPRGVGFQNLAACVDLLFQAARSYSLISPPRMGRRLIGCW
jgi:hypothetical protein